MKSIITKKAPAPIGPYSQAILVSDTLYISGQIAINPETGNLENSTLEAETLQVMKNIEAILQEAGFAFENVVKCSIFLSSMEHFTAVNKVYGSYFSAHPPARETVAVAGLPKKVNVEISAVAVKV